MQGCATGDLVTMRYDGEGRRVELVTRPSGGAAVTTSFRYQGAAIAQEFTGTGTPTVARTYVTDEAGSIVKFCDPDCSGANPQYLVTWNGHGDALALWRINADGTLTLANSFTYSTWGQPTTATHNSIADLGFRFLYVGRYGVTWDSGVALGAMSLELQYMSARHYSPTLGRFLQPDPSAAEANLYAYAGNDPVNTADPGGLEGFSLAEILYCINPLNFWTCQKAVLISASANEVSQAVIPVSKPNGRQDALRHCIWQACLTAAMGARLARILGDLHEDRSDNPPQFRAMDQHNNAWGRVVGRLWGKPAAVRRFVQPCMAFLNGGLLRRLAD